MGDKYDKAIAYLTEHPEEIFNAWSINGTADDPREHPAHCLFQRTDGNDYDDDSHCGCLTEVKAMCDKRPRAPTYALTIAIRNDTRIPTDVEQITVADLPVFAEWQRRIDKELNRK